MRSRPHEAAVAYNARVALLPIGDLPKLALESLAAALAAELACPVRILPEEATPFYAYHGDRDQFYAEAILAAMTAQPRGPEERVVAVTDVDLFAPDLNFIFGQADPEAHLAIISLHRLRQEFYDKPPRDDLLFARAIKEAVHELGHTFGLGHCRDTAYVMFFSNSLADTDRKGRRFCPSCRAHLEKYYARRPL